jgi:hypothetical protein
MLHVRVENNENLPLPVEIVGGSSSGTEYTEGDTDASIAGGALMWEDAADTLRPVSAAKPLPVNVVAGGTSGTQYTEADTDASITGTAMMMEGAADALVPAQGTVADGLLVNLGTNNDVTVSGVSTAAKQDEQTALLTTIDADTGGILTAVQTLDNAISGNEMQVDVVTLPAIPAGTNNIGDVDVLSIAAGTNTIGNVVPVPATSGGVSIFRSLDLDETEEEVKASAGQIYGWHIANLATTTRFIKFYNATAANVTVGTTTPVMTIPVPGNATDDTLALMALGGMGIPFDTAITVAATSALADADTTAPGANDVVINLFYK